MHLVLQGIPLEVRVQMSEGPKMVGNCSSSRKKSVVLTTFPSDHSNLKTSLFPCRSFTDCCLVGLSSGARNPMMQYPALSWEARNEKLDAGKFQYGSS